MSKPHTYSSYSKLLQLCIYVDAGFDTAALPVKIIKDVLIKQLTLPSFVP